MHPYLANEIFMPRRVNNTSGDLILFRPTFLSSYLGNRFALRRGKRVGAGATALQAAFATQGDGGLILCSIFGAVRRTVFHLAGENVTDQLAELYGIARALEALGCHRGSMPCLGALRERRNFKLYHYPSFRLLRISSALCWLQIAHGQFCWT
jgi:hypothetical protein